jgi:hypothetical protein
MEVTIDFSGHENIIRMMKAMPRAVDEVMTAEIQDAAMAGERKAKELVGVKTGNLRRSITSTPAKSIGGTVSATWGTNTLYAKHNEFGTDPHQIRPRNKKVLRFKGKAGKYVFARSVNHPGTTGRFYMRGSRDHIVRGIPSMKKRIANKIAKRWAGGG